MIEDYRDLEPIPENGNDFIADVSGTFICDVCDCEHDMNYKCGKCSDKAYINTYEDVFGDITSEWEYSGNVCGNCCNCLQHPYKRTLKTIKWEP